MYLDPSIVWISFLETSKLCLINGVHEPLGGKKSIFLGIPYGNILHRACLSFISFSMLFQFVDFRLLFPLTHPFYRRPHRPFPAPVLWLLFTR